MKKLKNYGLDLCYVTMAVAAWSRTPEIHVCDIVTNSRRACKDEWAQARRARKHREKGGYFSQFEWYSSLEKKSNFLRKKKETSNLVFLSINQMPRAKRLSSKTSDLGEFNFLKCTIILLIPVPILVRFMAIKMQKVALLKVFHHTAKRNSLRKTVKV